MIRLTRDPIGVGEILAKVQSPSAGAVVLFLGTTRELTGDRHTAWLEYECYEEMAERMLGKLETEARQQWPLVEVAIAHRLGRVAPGETSVAIAVSSAHREPAFEAGRWLIDRIKQVVPIWKQENWADGGRQWVHPSPHHEQETSDREKETNH